MEADVYAGQRQIELVSVIVPTRNGALTLGEQLAALSAQATTHSFEVVVVDNGSTDATPTIAREWVNADGRFRLIDAGEEAGINFARNRGAIASKGDLVLFCDSDDVVDQYWVEEMAHAARHADLIGGSLNIKEINRPEVQQMRPAAQPPNELPVALGFMSYATGANLGVWRPAADAVGWFDESFRSTGDDIDFSWRLQLAGYRLSFAPNAVVHYRLREELKATLVQAYRYGQGDVALFRKFRGDGVARGTFTGSLKSLVWLALDGLRDLPSRQRRPAWLWRASHLLGRYRGCLRYRVLLL